MRRAPRSSVRLAWAALLLCGAASANGRFPRAQRLVEDAAEPSRLAIYGTYGLLTTTDAGKTWQYVCEGATGPFSGESPLLELLPGARVVLNSETGLRGSTFPACDWQALLEPVMPSTLQDITREPTDDDALLALSNEPDLDVGLHSALSRSADGGKTWSKSVIVSTQFIARGVAVDVAPSLASRVYLSGLDNGKQGVLARSDDAGTAWQTFPINGTGSQEVPYLAAIDAANADHVFVRTDALKDHDGQLEPDDAFFYSPDGGPSFVRVLSRRAKLLGFALSPDGETLLLGYGDPVLFAYTVEPEQTGLYRLRMSDLVAAPETAATKLEKIFAGSVTCLRWTSHGLYACLAQAEHGFEAGRADDAEFSLADTKPFTPLLDLRSLSPLACPSTSSAGACLTDPNSGWPSVCGKLGANCDATASSGGTARPAAERVSSGCGCRATPRSALGSNWLLISMCCALLARRARSARDEPT